MSVVVLQMVCTQGSATSLQLHKCNEQYRSYLPTLLGRPPLAYTSHSQSSGTLKKVVLQRSILAGIGYLEVPLPV